jgi:hypothetical protein
MARGHREQSTDGKISINLKNPGKKGRDEKRKKDI